MTFRDHHSAPSGASTPHAFAPAAIMARAHAHAAEQAARVGKFTVGRNLTPAEALADLAADIERAAGAATDQPGNSGLVDRTAPDRPSAEALLASIARELDGGRA